MNYRMPNYGNTYTDTNNRLGYSAVSKSYAGGFSNKSIYRLNIKIMEMEMNRISVRLSLCLRMNVKSLKRPRINMSMTWTMREKCELNLRTN